MPIKKYSSAQIFKQSQLFWNIGVLRLDEPLSAYYLPIKTQNCQEGRVQVEHFTPSIPDAIYRLRKYERKGKFRYFGLKSRGIFTFCFPFPPPPASFFFFLVQFFGPGSLLGLISMGNVLENSRAYGIRRKEVQLGT